MITQNKPKDAKITVCKVFLNHLQNCFKLIGDFCHQSDPTQLAEQHPNCAQIDQLVKLVTSVVLVRLHDL